MRLEPSTRPPRRADPLRVPFGRDPLHDLDEAFEPLVLDLVGDLVGQLGRLGAATRRVDEREGAVVAHLLHDLECLPEVVLGLAREADDDVGAEREAGNRVAQLGDERQVALAVVGAAHQLQEPARPRLERQVDVLADRAAVGHGRDHGVAEVLRVRAREADALDALDRVAGAQQLAELGLEPGAQVAAPGVHVLAEQRDLLDAVGGEARHLGHDLAGPAALLATADGRDDAVRALGVAAHRHLYPGAERALAVHRQVAREVLVRPETATGRLSAGADPLAEVRIEPGPNATSTCG